MNRTRLIFLIVGILELILRIFVTVMFWRPGKKL